LKNLLFQVNDVNWKIGTEYLARLVGKEVEYFSYWDLALVLGSHISDDSPA